MTTAEHRIEVQRREALAKGNRTRTRRGKLKQHLKAGNVTLADVLRANKDYLATMRIGDLLVAVPGIGPTKTRETLKCLRISTSAEVQSISMRRREDLLAQLAHRYPAARIGI